jgi:predicted ATP-grasp superfamily ATP-dependent carboligase
MSEAGRSPAVVVNVNWVAGLSTIRSLGRAGVPVHAVDHRPDALGFRSRHTHTRHVSPWRLREPDAFVDFLAEVGDRLDAPAPLFLLDDDDLNTVASRLDRLGDRFLYPFPGWETLERIQDKAHQVQRARELGVPVPETRTEPTDELGFPVLVKPFQPGDFRRRFGVKAFHCRDLPDLEGAWERAQGFEPLVWEFIPGGDEELYTLGSYLSRDGEALGLFCGRKLVQDPPRVGNARVAESVWVDDVVDDGLRLLRGLGFHGPSQVEFKRDPRDGVFKLIEVNPRLWQWHGLAPACGVDLPVIAYRDLLGDPPPPARMENGRRRWAITFKHGKRPLPQPPPYVDPLLPWDDPAVAVGHLARVVGGTLSALPRRGSRSATH